MPTVHGYACLPHYAAHLAPILEALPDRLRGTLWGPHGVPLRSPSLLDPDAVVLVAGFNDGRRFAGRPVVLVEHGAGQSYPGDPRSAHHPSYSGGNEWDHAVGFVCPSDAVADRWRSRYPDTPAVAVGSPLLDRWHRVEPCRTTSTVIAFTFHWDCPLIPETRSAWKDYSRQLPALVDRFRRLGYGVVGHSHPRWGRFLRDAWTRMGVPVAEGMADLIEGGASVLVADNTSALYEFAAVTDRPVVALNAAGYRKDVHHGLRFWDAVPGVEVDHPDELPSAIVAALLDEPDLADRRRHAVTTAYAAVDGQAAVRAAAAVAAIVDRPR